MEVFIYKIVQKGTGKNIANLTIPAYTEDDAYYIAISMIDQVNFSVRLLK